MSKNAYVTFIIRNDSFMPGALVFAYALRLQETVHDLVVIVSENVTDRAKNTLRLVYDDVITIPEVFLFCHYLEFNKVFKLSSFSRNMMLSRFIFSSWLIVE